MGDLEVDLDELARCRDELGLLIAEFSRAEDIARGTDVGARTVADALHEFATNWNAHKKDLVEEMSSLHDMADASAHTYLDADNELAKDIADAVHEEHR